MSCSNLAGLSRVLGGGHPLALALFVAACGGSSAAWRPGPDGGSGTMSGDGGSGGEGGTNSGGDGGNGGNVADADAASEPPCGMPGALDTAFAQGGILIAETPKAQTQETIQAAWDGADGLYIGFSPVDKAIPDTTNSTSLSAVHIDGTGNLDTNFGTAGRVDASYPNVFNLAAIRRGAQSGAIYLLGYSAEQSGPSTVDSDTIVRITAQGAVDKSFGGDGHVQLGGPSGLPTGGYLADIVERSDGSILALTGVGFLHLSAAGALIDSTQASIFPVVQDPSYMGFLPAAGDSAVIVGVWSTPVDSPVVGPSVARYTAELALDKTFGNQGQALPPIGLGATEFPHAGGPNFGLFFGGSTQIAALDAKGSPVLGFGTGGIATVGNAVVASLARSDGSIVYVTVPLSEGPSISVQALTTSGAKDTTFGTNGALNIPKSITLSDPAMTKVDAQYVGPQALIAAGARRAYLVSIYGANEASGQTYTSLYLARFCVQ